MTTFDPYGPGVMPPLRYSETFAPVRRWAYFAGMNAQMCSRDTGYVHGPALPSLDTPSSPLLPMTYRGPMLQADGESRCYWEPTS